jgi:hypothetical protein
MRKFQLTLAFNQPVHTVITGMRPIPALPWDITGRDISTTVSSWEWGHGPVGVTAMVGEAIALSMMAEEDTMAGSAGPPTVNPLLAELARTMDIPTVTAGVRTTAAAHHVTRNSTETKGRDIAAIMGIEAMEATDNWQP